MRAIFINRFYWPDEPATAQLLTDLSEALAAKGQPVVVVASHPGRADVPSDEIRRGVRILRIRGTRWASRHGVIGKACDFATFFLGALSKLLFAARRGDAVIALTDPPLIGVGVALVAALRGARLYHWVQDIYPEVAIELAGQRWLAAFRPIRNLAWRRAARCVTLGQDMASVLQTSGVRADRISLAPNWAPTGTTPQPPEVADPLRESWGLTGKFIVAYCGNLGRVHDLDPILELARALRDESQLAIVFIGSGAQRAALESASRRLGLDNVHFHPSQPRASLAITLVLADIHLVTLRSGCERFVFPSKLVGVAAVGRPVLFIGPPDCEVAKIITQTDAGFGYAVARTDVAALADAIRRLSRDPAASAKLGHAALRYAETVGDANIAAARWHAWLRG